MTSGPTLAAIAAVFGICSEYTTTYAFAGEGSNQAFKPLSPELIDPTCGKVNVTVSADFDGNGSEDRAELRYRKWAGDPQKFGWDVATAYFEVTLVVELGHALESIRLLTLEEPFVVTEPFGVTMYLQSAGTIDNWVTDGPVTFEFPSPGLIFCEKSSKAYRWSREGFEDFWLSD